MLQQKDTVTAKSATFPLEGCGQKMQQVAVSLRAEGSVIRYYTNNEFTFNPGQVFIIRVPGMGTAAHYKLPIKLWSKVSLAASRSMTPCIINLRRNAAAKSPLTIPGGTKILEQVLTNETSCDYDSINAEDVLGQIVIRQQQELGSAEKFNGGSGSGEQVLFGSQSTWLHVQPNPTSGWQEEYKLDEVRFRLADQYQGMQFQTL